MSKTYLVTLDNDKIQKIDCDGFNYMPNGDIVFYIDKPRLATPDNQNLVERIVFCAFRLFKSMVDAEYVNKVGFDA